ncbi:hypothetical protein [Streptomyces shenzhenensis]|uniref:hypothetical protein n=1 Tax=Streptomyces shenzhenensis TaxID=943815 RepID=UPI00215DA8F6|nr:hypothetical protein [Streptomyces shenzhenensis]
MSATSTGSVTASVRLVVVWSMTSSAPSDVTAPLLRGLAVAITWAPAFFTALDAIQTDPAKASKPTRAVTAACITASRTHKAAARRLGVSYGTYRRHLALAKERLIEQLLRQPARHPHRPG